MSNIIDAKCCQCNTGTDIIPGTGLLLSTDTEEDPDSNNNHHHHYQYHHHYYHHHYHHRQQNKFDMIKLDFNNEPIIRRHCTSACCFYHYQKTNVCNKDNCLYCLYWVHSSQTSNGNDNGNDVDQMLKPIVSSVFYCNVHPTGQYYDRRFRQHQYRQPNGQTATVVDFNVYHKNNRIFYEPNTVNQEQENQWQLSTVGRWTLAPPTLSNYNLHCSSTFVSLSSLLTTPFNLFLHLIVFLFSYLANWILNNINDGHYQLDNINKKQILMKQSADDNNNDNDDTYHRMNRLAKKLFFVTELLFINFQPILSNHLLLVPSLLASMLFYLWCSLKINSTSIHFYWSLIRHTILHHYHWLIRLLKIFISS